MKAFNRGQIKNVEQPSILWDQSWDRQIGCFTAILVMFWSKVLFSLLSGWLDPFYLKGSLGAESDDSYIFQ